MAQDNRSQGASNPSTVVESVRRRVQTEKGKEYTRERLKSSYRSAKREWRIQLYKTQSLLVSGIDISTLRHQSSILEVRMNDLSNVQQALESALTGDDEREELFNNYESLAKENMEILRQLSNTLRELELRVDEASSTYSRRSSHTSTSSKKSRRSSRKSISSSVKRCELEEKIAVLKAKMSLVHEKEQLDRGYRQQLEEIHWKKSEVQCEEDRLLDDIKTSKESFKIKEELLQSEARMGAYSKVTQEDVLSLNYNGPPLEDGSSDHLQQFLDSQVVITVPEVSQLHIATSSAEPQNPLNLPKSTAPLRQTQLGPSVASRLNPNARAYAPYTVEDDKVSHPPPVDDSQTAQLLDIVKLLAQSQCQNRMPLPEPGVFSGDLLQYPSWIQAFETLIGCRSYTPTEKLYFLRRYVTGEAKAAVDGLMFLNSEDAYDKAKEMLAKRFGDPFAVAAAFRRKLDLWPKIFPGDVKGFRRYTDFLLHCEKAMEKIDSLKALNDDQENRKMISKLPRWIVNRWSRRVYDYKEGTGKFPPFKEFVSFLVKEADIACDPMFSIQTTKNEDFKIPLKDISARTKQRNIIGVSTLATSSRKSFNQGGVDNKTKENPSIKPCVLCKDSHDIDVCKEFLKKTVQARKEFAVTKGLCFACLQQGHRSRECDERKTCQTCNKLHPTALHGDYKGWITVKNVNREESAKENQIIEATSNYTKVKADDKVQTNSMIVPVWVYHRDKPSNEQLVYALLDDQSDTTFIKEKTIKNLGISGQKTQLRLSTMHAQGKVIDTHKIKGLVIRDFYRQVSICLPDTFSRGNIPANRSQIPRPESASQWPHLKHIANQLVPYRDDIDVALLIGLDCSRAIMPRQIIPGDDNKPYALKTDLGWGIVGRVDQSAIDDDEEQDHIGITHRIVACEVLNLPKLQCQSSSQTSTAIKTTCHFSCKTQVKEVINPYQVCKMLELDFSEVYEEEKSLSRDESVFLKKMQVGIHQRPDAHYEMPLPFREEDPKLPNNKNLALHRLSKLKSRMEGDEKYRQLYIAAMNDVIDKGFAEKVPEIRKPSDNGKVWYIPHHGVFHPKRAFAMCLDLKKRFKTKSLKQPQQLMVVDELRQAERVIVKLVQEEAFKEEIKILQILDSQDPITNRRLARQRNTSMKRTSSLYRLDPFLDNEEILRVGGRIRRLEGSYEIMHPTILPRKSHVTQLVVRHFHQKIHHQGRGMTLNELRSNGYWIIGGSTAVSNYIANCVTCRKLRGPVQEQKMADLPIDRLQPAPPFTFSAVDYFGPWYIKEGRKVLKRYGVIFTCMACRAIHLETANSLDTSSFINALRRFINRRGPVTQLRSDRGTNFVGAKRELQEALSEMDQSRIQKFLLQKNCDWIKFQMNVPSASHMGGSWERQIRTVRNVLTALLNESGQQLDDESLRTFMCETESVVNSRPLTTESLSSPDSPEALTPNHLLTMKSHVVLPPPGEFLRADLYSRKRWRRVQHLANEFWLRWKKEYLHSLQERQKWTRPRRNLQSNDVVIIKDETLPRNQWSLAKVEETPIDKDGLIRKVKLIIGDRTIDAKGRRLKQVMSRLERPIHKVVLLVPHEDLEQD